MHVKHLSLSSLLLLCCTFPRELRSGIASTRAVSSMLSPLLFSPHESSLSALSPHLHHRTLRIPLLRLASFLALLNLRDHALESFADILVVPRASFGETAA